MVDGEPPGLSRDLQQTRLEATIRAADELTGFIERPIRRVSGSPRFNPLPHAGTISVFLLGVVIVSGLYITLFFSFGYAASYDAVASMEGHAIQRIVRAVHRYSSAALVLTTVVHGWRIFTSQRFTSPRRRWRWATGVASLGLVWLAGVTGYWLVWDRRAAALSEITAKLFGNFGPARGFVVRNLLGLSPGSGSGTLLVLWFVHLGLTAVIGWFMIRHLRRSRQPWLPPAHWIMLMGGALLAVSVVIPLGMLGPARPDQLVTDMPLDPFVLFLLPPLLSSARWLTMAVTVTAAILAVVLPWLVRRSDPATVLIDERACTGCEICVHDCPYEALTMGQSSDQHAQIAVLDASQCVSCGICLGSCAFDAIELPGWTSSAQDVAGRDVRVICSRHEHSLPAQPDELAVWVNCAGMFAPNAARGFTERGATSVELIGCAPSDCRYGIGNTLASERLAGERAPHPPRRYARDVSTSWVSPNDVARRSSTADDDDEDTTPNRSQLTAPGLLVLLSLLVVVAATRTPFRTESEDAAIRVVVDHLWGAEVVELGISSPEIDAVALVIDGQRRDTQSIGGADDHSIGFTDWSISPGPHRIDVRLVDSSGDRQVLFSDDVALDARERLIITATDVPPDPSREDGRRVFNSRSAGCAVCHSVQEGRDGVGPSLYGLADRAGSTVQGLSTEQYVRQSILLPDQHIVDGWPSGQMLPIYRERLAEENLNALITYLKTLTAETG